MAINFSLGITIILHKDNVHCLITVINKTRVSIGRGKGKLAFVFILVIYFLILGLGITGFSYIWDFDC